MFNYLNRDGGRICVYCIFFIYFSVKPVELVKLPSDLLEELYVKYREAIEDGQNTISARRLLKHDKQYEIHVTKLKEVNGFKSHNLMVKEVVSKQNPLIYINNPVESKLPNPFLTLEEFKNALSKRIQAQKDELEHAERKERQRLLRSKVSSIKIIKPQPNSTGTVNGKLSSLKNKITTYQIQNESISHKTSNNLKINMKIFQTKIRAKNEPKVQSTSEKESSTTKTEKNKSAELILANKILTAQPTKRNESDKVTTNYNLSFSTTEGEPLLKISIETEKTLLANNAFEATNSSTLNLSNTKELTENTSPIKLINSTEMIQDFTDEYTIVSNDTLSTDSTSIYTEKNTTTAVNFNVTKRVVKVQQQRLKVSKPAIFTKQSTKKTTKRKRSTLGVSL